MIQLEARAYLVKQGDPASSAFLVESGCLEVLLEQPDGEQLIAVLGPGEIVGEMALVDSSPRSASVRARVASTLMPITPGQIDNRLANADPVLRLLLETVLTRFRATLDQVGGRSAHVRARPDTSAIKCAALAQLAMAREFAQAIDGEEIAVHYQPIVDLADGRIVELEALARWHHLTHGPIPPSMFVPVAEANDLSAALAARVLRIVMRDLPLLTAAAEKSGGPVRVAINISGQDLGKPGFIEELGALAGPMTSSVTLELTETALVRSPAAASSLAAARALGFRVAVDDFGAGYASYGYVQTLPVDGLKIDRSFVEGMSESFTSRSIIASMVQLSTALNLETVGEGIETDGDLAALRASGCTLGQGYLFSRPVPFIDTLAFFADWPSSKLFASFSHAQADHEIESAPCFLTA